MSEQRAESTNPDVLWTVFTSLCFTLVQRNTRTHKKYSTSIELSVPNKAQEETEQIPASISK